MADAPSRRAREGSRDSHGARRLAVATLRRVRARLDLLRCPATGQRLHLADDGRLHTEDHHLSYAVVDGVPVLIDDATSVFSAADVALSGGGPTRPSFRALLRRFAPATSINPGAPDRYAMFQRELRSITPERSASVLVIGGGELGKGLDQLAGAPDIDLVETDVYLGPRVDVACDGHHLPFADACFDGVIVQAVLEHVADPHQVVAEIHRVLRPHGIVYAETPFMQQVHEGPFDFTRFTDLGHRRLFRQFSEIDRGVAVGPASALLWSLRYFVRSFTRRPSFASAADRAISLSFFWLRYIDHALVGRPGAIDAASGFYFLGIRSDETISDRALVHMYRGLLPSPTMARGIGASELDEM
jgi:SAM-dependent methyltransferase